ncbi:putative protein kinase C eta type [Nematocida major]|uniref:putative protein kinase C eta type n=1 Tax=Nematocida major TaxID=1912982 RepID=UPI0020089CCA|nr:putative protein kinase C eta type [Nematocida major]KAH9386315.1 putative protein kinase C eta type [Nematocida major]
MPDKQPNTVKIIKKLTEMLPRLSETEAEAARYQIEQLKNENPFMSGQEKSPGSVLECWEARDTSRAIALKKRLSLEKNLLEGYRVILQENTTDLLLERVDKAQRVIYFIEKEISQMKKLLADATLASKNTALSMLFYTEEAKQEAAPKHSGHARLSIVGIDTKNPLHKDIAVHIYTDDICIGQIKASEVNEGKSVSIDFQNISRMEFLIKAKGDLVIGLVYFPVQDLVDAEDLGVRSFYYNIVDKSTLSISFGKCVLDSGGIQRSTKSISTKKSAEHLLRRLGSISMHRCGVCGDSKKELKESQFFRCDLCKFTCHTECAYLIFFECVEFKKKKEAEAEKMELEQRLNEMKRDRINIIIAAIDIREKPREDEGIADRTLKKMHREGGGCRESGSSHGSESEDSSEEPRAPTKRYSVEHALSKQKMLGVTWCCHCGDKIGMLAMALVCSTCQNTYHIECRGMLFKSCGISHELLEGLITCIPKHHKRAKHSKISIEEFEFVSLLCKGPLGKVYMCMWRDRAVALKVMKKKEIIVQNSMDLLDAEKTCLEIAKKSENPFIIKLEECFQTKTHLFFVTEFLPGGDLYFNLHCREMSSAEIRMVLAGIILGLEWLHGENIIYRDLRLENVLFDQTGYVKLGSFGLCSIGAQRGVAHTLCGAMTNIAPEVIDEHYTKTADWWSLGVLAYQLMLKTLPFSGSSIKQIKEAIQNDPPAELGKIEEPARSFIAGLLEKSPEKRLGSDSVGKIKSHPYFEGLDWEKMKALELPVEWRPSGEGRNFEVAETDEDPSLSPAEEIDPTLDARFDDF